MRILDRYILRPVFVIFFTCIFLFLFLYIIIDILSHLDEILKQNATVSALIQYYLLYLPIMFVQVAPFACLLSTLYTFGKLNHNNEIIAMRSSGLSVPQITKTVIAFGFVISVLVFWVNNRFVPNSLLKTQNMKQQMNKDTRKTKIKEQQVINDLYIYGFKNRLLSINKFYPSTNTMEGITILEHDEHQNIAKKIVATKGVYENNLWKFYESVTYDFDQRGQVLGEPRYLEEEIMSMLERPSDLINQRQRPDLMNISQLEDYIWKFSKSGASGVIRNLRVELYQRFTSPFTSVVIIFLGIPFALMLKKRGTGLSSVAISIMVGFLYYISEAVSIALGRGGLFTPLLAASFSHIAALAASLYLINRMP